MNPYSIVGALLLLIATAFGGAHVGRKLERERWQARELEIAQHNAVLISDAAQRAQRIQAFNEAKARKASEEHEKALSDLRARYAADLAAVRAAGGLRIPATACAGTSAAEQGASPGGPHEASPGTIKLPDRIESDLFAMTKRADDLAEQLRALQGWVRDNGFYGGADGKENPSR